MKRIIIFYMFAMFFSWNIIKSMEIASHQNNEYNNNYKTGKMVIAQTRQYAAMGSIASGFAFFTATAARNMHWPYWIKRAPLFGFISFNAIGQMPTIMGLENDVMKTTYIGHIYNSLKKA